MFTEIISSMGDAQSIPVVGEVVTAAQSTTKFVAAGACALVGEDEAADRFLEGSKNSWKEYSEKNFIAATVNATVHKIKGDDDEADRNTKKMFKSLEGVVDNTPGIGHAKGIVHYAIGDTEHGNRCMIGASRSTLVAGAGALTGGIGGGVVLGGLAGAETGLAYDLVHSGIDSAVHNEKRFTDLLEQ